MSYPGNPSLSQEIRERILATYRQTLELASQGNRQEASLGCDFILRLDREFTPARRLMERLEAGQGPVEVADLELGAVTADSPNGPAEAPVSAPPAGDEELGDLDLDSLDLELPALSLADSDEDVPAAAESLHQELARLLEEHRFDEILSRAEAERQAVLADGELSRIVTTAQERQQAEPYVRDLLASARRALSAGKEHEAERHLAEVRTLDPDHPELRELDREVGARPASPSLEDTEAVPAAGDAAPHGDLVESESDRRIRELLEEGQQAFERADYQTAIDAWSRIFLIDIDHEEAASRIDEARRLKAEQERRIEEILHEGTSNLAAGEVEAARSSFERVLELQPGHLAAREYLEQIASGRVPAPRGADHPGVEAGSLASLPAEIPEPAEDAVLKEEILVPPEPGARPAREEPESQGRVAAAADRGGRAFVLIGGVVLAAVLGLGWFLFSNWDRFFPNATSDALPPPAEEDPIARATQLHESGRTTYAITQLRRIPPTDPHYQEAQALMSQWEAEAPAAGEDEEPDGGGLDEAERERRERFLATARDALASGEDLGALDALEQAGAIAPLAEQELEWKAQAEANLDPLRRQIELMRGGDWEFALPELWRMRDENAGDPDVERLIVDGHYNLGVRELQRGDPAAALEHFEEAAVLAPDDEEMRRHYLFARTYQSRAKDLLFQIYVKYLPFR